MDFRIRPASVHDADALREVHAAGRGLAEPDRDADWYRTMIDAPGTPRAGTWVVEVEDAPVGFGHFRATADPALGDLTLFYLHPDAQGRGVARPLLDGVLDDMRVLEFRSVRAEADAGNARAIRFYERAGFRFTDEEGGLVHYQLAL
jgi:ribosomal protein S18 acetylase RimI-like enzyme